MLGIRCERGNVYMRCGVQCVCVGSVIQHYYYYAIHQECGESPETQGSQESKQISSIIQWIAVRRSNDRILHDYAL